MSTDYGEKERQFLASLKADTGRDLGEWMAAISAQRLSHRNDIIDWLRRQGFMFSKASWLERIHHNDGQPIYGEGARLRTASDPRRNRAQQTASAPAAVQRPPTPEVVAPRPPATAAPSPTAAPGDDGLDRLLAKAKAFRPLAQYVLTTIAKAVPGSRFTAAETHVEIAAALPFAILAVGPRELRLGLALGTKPFDQLLQPSRFAGLSTRIPPSITHMLVLTDARQVTPALTAHIVEAARRPG